MGISVQWDDEATKQALLFVYEGTWTWDENYKAINDAVPLFNSVDHIVDIIIDMSRSSGYPPGNLLSHFREISKRYNERAGHNVIITNNNFVRMMSDVFHRIYKPQKIKGKIFFVKNLDEARKVLAQYRQVREQKEKN